jgi:2-polyprenyl-3-methyl-5-hydroxy-6-metoxy-1,4-benzoquinol methylase
MSTTTAADHFEAEAATWSERYNERKQFRDRLRTVVSWIRENPQGQRLLDYGCGSGNLITNLAKAGFITTGVDIAPGMLKASQNSLLGAGIAPDRFQLELVQADGNVDAFARKFDGVTSLGVIEYLDNPQAVLEKLAGVLNPNGFLIVSVPNKSSLLRRVERFVFNHPTIFRMLGLFPNQTSPDCYVKFLKNEFYLKELEALLGRWGLKRQRVFYHGGVPSFLGAFDQSPALALSFIAEFRKAK